MTTPPPSSSPLVERVAKAINDANYAHRFCTLPERKSAAALAAVRVVVEAAAEVCESKADDTCHECGEWYAELIRRLLPSEPEA